MLIVILSNSPDKSPSDSLQHLIYRLLDIPTTLPDDYQSDTILRGKIFYAVRDARNFQLACHKPSGTVQGAIYDLHASLLTSERAKTNSANTHDGLSVQYVDRRYIRTGPNNRREDPSNQNRKCIVCNRIVYWSTNHSTKARLDSFKKIKSLQQFIASLDYDDSDDDDRNLADALEGVTAHIIDMNPNAFDDDNSQDGFFSHMATIDNTDECAAFTVAEQKATTIHALTANLAPHRYDGSFYGIVINRGCACCISSGHAQYLAYCKVTRPKPTKYSNEARHFQFGIRPELSKETAIIDFLLGDLWLSVDVHVVSSDIPIFLGLSHMDRLGIFLNNLSNRFLHKDSKQSVAAPRLFGEAFI